LQLKGKLHGRRGQNERKKKRVKHLSKKKGHLKKTASTPNWGGVLLISKPYRRREVEADKGKRVSSLTTTQRRKDNLRDLCLCRQKEKPKTTLR